MTVDKAFALRIAAVCVAAALLASCSSSGNTGKTNAPVASARATTTGGASAGSTAPGSSGLPSVVAVTPKGAKVTVSEAMTSLGTALAVNSHTLYRYDPDTSSASHCVGSCAALWPPVVGIPSAGTGVSAAKLGAISRTDGSTQLTYDGHPLYTYSGDTKAGAATGNGLEGVWHAMTLSAVPSGASSASAATSASSGGGGGYGY